MPLEVRQIGIRLSVGDEAHDPELLAAEGDDMQVPPEERRAIVDECVAAVLAALRAQGER